MYNFSNNGSEIEDSGIKTSTLAREHESMQGILARSYVRHVGTWAREHAEHVRTQSTLAPEHVSTQSTLAREHVFSTQDAQFSRLADGSSSNAKLFADDISLFSVIHDADAYANELNNELYQINKWAFQ